MNRQAYQPFGIAPSILDAGEAAMSQVATRFSEILAVREYNQLKVLHALHEARISESQMGGTTGYGYDDLGRAQLEKAYAVAFGAQSALVRIQIGSGTQAIAMCLFGLLRPGDELLSVTGSPYDTLAQTIGQTGETGGHETGSLAEFGVHYRQVDLLPDGTPDLESIVSALNPRTRVVYIQKSRGYTTRRSLMSRDIAAISKAIRSTGHAAVIFVDNCYGEFVETTEPCEVGADLCAGSLIKNPGGGISPSGGYVCGRQDLVELAAARLSAPGLGSHVGPSLGFTRLMAQGFYLAPHIVAESLMGAVFASALFARFGFKTFPTPPEARGDLVQTIEFGKAEPLVSFCQAIQAASPVDAFVTPLPWAMPGYDSEVIMASGAFISGSSIELSADGPLRPPYPAYLQGGMSFDNIRLACLLALQKMTASSSGGAG